MIRRANSGPTQKSGGVFISRKKSSLAKMLTPTKQIVAFDPFSSSSTQAHFASQSSRRSHASLKSLLERR